ncbi:MAG: hypothetical protein EBU82_15265 [Flavobacteriia bacterium]|nr:hypothetical protein [Flavobacteriia bacterium]
MADLKKRMDDLEERVSRLEKGGATAGKKGETRKKRKSSGPNGYMKFSKEMRPKIVAENPKMKSDVIAVAREIGKRWRALSEEERKKY